MSIIIETMSFRWRQLAMVTGFYFIFVFIFALMGIHIIGGLDYFCTYRTIDEEGNVRYIDRQKIQWNLYNPDTIGTSVPIIEVS